MLTNDYQAVATLPPGSPFRSVRSALAVPFGWDEELHGVLSLGWERHHTVGTEDLTVLETFTELAGVACRNASAHAYLAREIGRASCRAGAEVTVGAAAREKTD